jgi:hypothetical protein
MPRYRSPIRPVSKGRKPVTERALSLIKLVSFSASFDTDLDKTPSYMGWIGLRANW